MRLAMLVVLSAVTATPLAAQFRPDDPFARSTPAPSSVSVASAAPSREGVFALRLLTGAIGAGAGMIAGGVAGYHLLPQGDCGDDPGLCEAAVGAAIGAVVGAAAGAAFPRGDATCGFDRRFGAGLLGAAGGGLVGFLAGRNSGGMVIVSVPLGATIGGAIGANRC